MTIRFSRDEGCYNWCNPSEKKACLQVMGLPESAPIRHFSETTEIDGRFDYQGDDLWEMLDAIEGQCKSWLISTSREKTLQAIAWMRDNKLTIDVQIWHDIAIERQKKAAKASEAARSAWSAYQYAIDDASDVEAAPLTEKPKQPEAV